METFPGAERLSTDDVNTILYYLVADRTLDDLRGERDFVFDFGIIESDATSALILYRPNVILRCRLDSQGRVCDPIVIGNQLHLALDALAGRPDMPIAVRSYAEMMAVIRAGGSLLSWQEIPGSSARAYSIDHEGVHRVWQFEVADGDSLTRRDALAFGRGCSQVLDAEEWQSLAERLVMLVSSGGSSDPAADLWLAAGCYEQIVALLDAGAPGMGVTRERALRERDAILENLDRLISK